VRIEINRESHEPLYRQIAEQIRLQVEAGILEPGERLPSTRELAEWLGVSRLVVKRAYELLREEGVLVSHVGRGSFVNPEFSRRRAEVRRPDRPKKLRAYFPAGQVSLTPMDWERYEQDHSAYLTLVELARPDRFRGMVNFTSALVDSSTVPVERVLEVVRYQLSNFGPAVLRLNPLQGHEPLLEWLRRELEREGVDFSQNDLCIVTRFQHALELVHFLMTMLRPGGVVCEVPTYQQFVNFITVSGVPVYTCPVDGDGVVLERLEEILRRREVSYLYLQPNFHNPTGGCLSGKRRAGLLELLSRYRVPLLEDDTLRMVKLNGRHFYPLKADDTGGYIFLAGSFSKVLSVGFNVGYLVFPKALTDAVLRVKRCLEPGPSLLIQASFWEFVRRGYLEKHLRKMHREYKRRRDAFLEMVEKHFPPEVEVSYPEGGLTVWVRLPESLKEEEVIMTARAERVVVPPSSFFTPGYRPIGGFRLSFGRLPMDELAEGTRRLGKVLRRLVREVSA